MLLKLATLNSPHLCKPTLAKCRTSSVWISAALGVIWALAEESLKKFRHQRDSNPGLSDTSWAFLLTELRSRTLGTRILGLENIFNWLGFKTLICFIIFQVSSLSCCCLWVIWSLALSLWHVYRCIVFASASAQLEITEKWITSLVYLRRCI